MKRFTIASAILAALITGGASEALSYDYVPINVPGADATIPFDINNSRNVAGTYYTNGGMSNGVQHGFIFNGKGYSTIDYPGASNTSVLGMNDKGKVVGAYSDGSKLHGFIYGSGKFKTIDFPGASHTVLDDINNLSVIAGMDYADHFGAGFTYFKGKFTPFQNVPPDIDLMANGINDSGLVVGGFFDAGHYSFSYQNGNFGYGAFDYTPAIETESIAYGVNNRGQVVGNFANIVNGGYIDTNGNFTEFFFPGSTTTTLTGINDFGDLVGYGDTGSFIALNGSTPLNSHKAAEPSSMLFLYSTVGGLLFRKKLSSI